MFEGVCFLRSNRYGHPVVVEKCFFEFGAFLASWPRILVRECAIAGGAFTRLCEVHFGQRDGEKHVLAIGVIGHAAVHQFFELVVQIDIVRSEVVTDLDGWVRVRVGIRVRVRVGVRVGFS